MSTERLYYANAYLTSFTARVLARDDDGRRVYLDRTALYPTSGGQPRDTGCLNGISVVDVVDEDERIAHVLAVPLDADFVRGEVDWDRALRPHAAAQRAAPALGDLRRRRSATRR